MKVLVIGGSGFVGHAIVRALLRNGFDVSLLNRGNRPVPQTRQLSADRDDKAAFRLAVQDMQFDAVIDTNCYNPEQARLVVEVLAGRTSRVLMISSASVYAEPEGDLPEEHATTGGAAVWGDYGRDKSAAETVYRRAIGRFDDFVAFRPPYVFGPNNNLDRERWFWRRALHGRPVLVPGLGEANLQFIHEDDLAEAVAFFLRGRDPDHGTAVNVADPEIVRSADFGGLLARIAGMEDRSVIVGDAAGRLPARSWYPFRDVNCAVDTARMSDTIGWKPKHSLEERFRQTFSHLETDLRDSVDDWTPVEETLLRRIEHP